MALKAVRDTDMVSPLHLIQKGWGFVLLMSQGGRFLHKKMYYKVVMLEGFLPPTLNRFAQAVILSGGKLIQRGRGVYPGYYSRIPALHQPAIVETFTFSNWAAIRAE